MGEPALKLVERRMTSKLYLGVPADCPARSFQMVPEMMADEARLSGRLVSWLEQHSVGHVPSPVQLRAQSLTMDGQAMRTRIAAEGGIYDETSLLMRLLVHDYVETVFDDPKTPGFILVADGSPNLLPLGSNLAINVCRIGHCVHLAPHWDGDLVKIDDRYGNWAHANVITVERRY